MEVEEKSVADRCVIFPASSRKVQKCSELVVGMALTGRKIIYVAAVGIIMASSVCSQQQPCVGRQNRGKDDALMMIGFSPFLGFVWRFGAT